MEAATVSVRSCEKFETGKLKTVLKK